MICVSLQYQIGKSWKNPAEKRVKTDRDGVMPDAEAPRGAVSGSAFPADGARFPPFIQFSLDFERRPEYNGFKAIPHNSTHAS